MSVPYRARRAAARAAAAAGPPPAGDDGPPPAPMFGLPPPPPPSGTRAKKDRRARRAAANAAPPAPADPSVLSGRLSDLLAAGADTAAARLSLRGAGAPAFSLRPPPAPPALPDLDASLPSDADFLWSRAAAAHAERAAAAAEWLGSAAAAADDYDEICRLRPAAAAARLNAARAAAAADAAALPLDVRAAAGMSTAPAVDLHDAARAGAGAAAAALPPDAWSLIAARLPISARPARADGLVRRAAAWAADIAAAAARPAVDVLGVARDLARHAPAPPRPPAGWFGLVDGGDDDDVPPAGRAFEVDDDEPESGYQWFVHRINDGDFAGLYHGDWRMPASGAQCSRGGEFVRLKACASDDHPACGVDFDTGAAVEYSCHRLDCPVCFETSIARKSARTVSRIYGLIGWRRSDLNAAPRKRIPLHCVLSAPDSMYDKLDSIEGVKAANAFVRRRLAAVGLESAAVLFHAFRFDKKHGGAPYYSPHFHVIATGWVSGKSVAELAAEDGWVFKVIRPIHSKEHLHMTVSYVLSHVAVATRPSGRVADVIRYFGLMGPAKFGNYDVLEAQHDVTVPLDRVFKERSRGKRPLLPAAVLEHGAPPDGSAFVPSVSVRLYEPADESREDGDGRRHTVTRFASMVEVAAARVDGFELRGRADYDRLLDRLAAHAHRDNPAFRPINSDDVKGGPECLEAACARAGGRADGARLPPARLMVVRVDYVPAAGEGAVHGNNPTKPPRGRVLTFVLRPDVRGLCMICRRPLRVGVRLADAAALPVHEWPVGEPILVPRDRLRLYNPEEDSLVPIYSRKDGTSDFDDHILKAPPYMAAYPPHVRAAVRRSVEESEVSYQMWQNTGKRPTLDVVRAEMNSMRMRARAATSGLAPADDRL